MICLIDCLNSYLYMTYTYRISLLKHCSEMFHYFLNLKESIYLL